MCSSSFLLPSTETGANRGNRAPCGAGFGQGKPVQFLFLWRLGRSKSLPGVDSDFEDELGLKGNRELLGWCPSNRRESSAGAVGWRREACGFLSVSWSPAADELKGCQGQQKGKASHGAEWLRVPSLPSGSVLSQNRRQLSRSGYRSLLPFVRRRLKHLKLSVPPRCLFGRLTPRWPELQQARLVRCSAEPLCSTRKNPAKPIRPLLPHPHLDGEDGYYHL